MREIGASEAKVHLPQLLDAVERGETVIITRHGRIRTDEARVPGLWWFEIRNTLIVNERRGRLAEADTAAFLRGLAGLGVTVDRAPDEAVVLALARRHRLTVYDAAYLELAQREAVKLATLDVDLATAARAEKLFLLGEPQP